MWTGLYYYCIRLSRIYCGSAINTPYYSKLMLSKIRDMTQILQLIWRGYQLNIWMNSKSNGR